MIHLNHEKLTECFAGDQDSSVLWQKTESLVIVVELVQATAARTRKKIDGELTVSQRESV
jgi:hypothetical protein